MFDVEVYDAFQSFFAELCQGFRRFLFFINEVPFFNASGFLKGKEFQDGTQDFLDNWVGTRAFSNFLEEEVQPDLYHVRVVQCIDGDCDSNDED